jgi:hypothetical protein
MTQVKFFYNPEYKELFAVFPNDRIRGIFGTILYTCYSKIGQHTSCDSEYVRESRPAQREEYIPLLNELSNCGYNDLEIVM